MLNIHFLKFSSLIFALIKLSGMKKFILFALLFGILISANAQAKKYIFLEHVTNSNCGVCGASNPGFYSVIQPYQGSYHHLSIHPSFPYTSCVFYQANKTENNERAAYYSVSSTPTIVINGLTKKSASQIKASTMEAELGKTSAIEIIVKESGSTNRSVNVEVKTVGNKPSGSYKIFAAIAEKTRNQATPNGEKVHYDVFRKFVTASAGDVINLADNGSSINLNYSYSVNSAWVESETYLLVWIQDNNTKEVLNSGSRFDVTSSSVDLSSSDIKILTNPVRSDLSVQLSKQLEGNYYILNIMGQVLEKGNLDLQGTRLDLSVSNYKSGMYFLRIESNGVKITKRWIKESFNP